MRAARSLSYTLEGKNYEPKNPALKKDFPAIFIPFDEAHTLLRRPQKSHPGATIVSDDVDLDSADMEPDGSWSLWSQLRRSLRVLMADNVFALFLSTTGSISQFNPTRDKESSARLTGGLLVLMPPFCCLGFDQLALKLPAQPTFGHLVKWEYQVSLGRPLQVPYSGCIIIC